MSEDVPDELLHSCRAFARVPDEFIGVTVQTALVSFGQQAGVGGDHPERFFEIVRGGIGKAFQLRIGAGELLGLV